MADATRLIWLSDSPTLATGFGTVGRRVLGQLAADRGYEVCALGWYYRGDPYEPDDFPYRIVPQAHSGEDGGNLLRVLSPDGQDVLLTLGDPWNFGWVAKLRTRVDFKWVAYLTVCSSPLPTETIEYLSEADGVAVASEFGAEVLGAALPDATIEVIPFGVDTEVFCPLPNRDDLRTENGLGDRFVVGFVGRNQPRKQLPVLIKAFARFHEAHPDSFLYLHTDENDVGWDVPGLLERHGLSEASGVTADCDVQRGLSDQELNEIYNLFDVFVLPSMGEGFGLPLLEAMAAGVPVMTTDYSSNRDLVSGRGELIAIRTFVTGTLLNFELPVPDEDDLAERLDILYQDKDRRLSCRERGLTFSEELTWERCAEVVHNLVQGVASGTAE